MMPMGRVSRPCRRLADCPASPKEAKKETQSSGLDTSGGLGRLWRALASNADSWAMLEVLIREPGNEPPSAAQEQPLEKQ